MVSRTGENSSSNGPFGEPFWLCGRILLYLWSSERHPWPWHDAGTALWPLLAIYRTRANPAATHGRRRFDGRRGRFRWRRYKWRWRWFAFRRMLPSPSHAHAHASAYCLAHGHGLTNLLYRTRFVRPLACVHAAFTGSHALLKKRSVLHVALSDYQWLRGVLFSTLLWRDVRVRALFGRPLFGMFRINEW